MESGYLLTKRMMLSPSPPTALFVSNGMMGMGALKALKELSLCCPEDVALAVFDELPGNECYSPGVTVVAQPEYEIGYRGAKMLIGQIENGERAEPQAITLNAELRIRESTRLRFGTTRSDVR